MSIINSCKNISNSYKKIPKLKNFQFVRTLSYNDGMRHVECYKKLTRISWVCELSVCVFMPSAALATPSLNVSDIPSNDISAYATPLKCPNSRTHLTMTSTRQASSIAIGSSEGRSDCVSGLNYWVTRILFSWTEPKITVNGPTHSVTILPSHAKLRTGIPWPLRNRAGLIYVVQHRSSSLHFFRCLSHFFSTQLHIMLIMSMNDELGILSISRYSPSA